MDTSKEALTVIGGGLAGMSFLRALEKRNAAAKLVETRDYFGSVFSLDDIPTRNDKSAKDYLRQYLGDVDEDSVELSTTAVSLNGEIWLVSDEGSKKATNPISATGFRAMTLGELDLYGDRPSGILGIRSVVDALRLGYEIGSKIVLYGFNHYSLFIAKRLLENGAEVTIIDEVFDSFIHSSEDAERIGCNLMQDRAEAIKGGRRIEKIVTGKGNVVEADSLVICKFVASNYLHTEMAVGNSIKVIEDPSAIVDLSEIVAESLTSTSNRCTVDSNIPFYPSNPPSDGRMLVFIPRKGGQLLVNDERMNCDSQCREIKLNNESHVKVVFS